MPEIADHQYDPLEFGGGRSKDRIQRPYKRRRWENDPRFATLDHRERLVAGAIAEGYSTEGAAKRLGITASFVVHLKKEIYAKLNINDNPDRNPGTLLTHMIVRAELED